MNPNTSKSPRVMYTLPSAVGSAIARVAAAAAAASALPAVGLPPAAAAGPAPAEYLSAVASLPWLRVDLRATTVTDFLSLLSTSNVIS